MIHFGLLHRRPAALRSATCCHYNIPLPKKKKQPDLDGKTGHGRGVQGVHTHTHARMHAQPSQWEQDCGIRAAVGGGLVADTFLLTITSHTGTHIPTSWWPPSPPAPTPVLFPWATSDGHPPPPAGPGGTLLILMCFKTVQDSEKAHPRFKMFTEK